MKYALITPPEGASLFKVRNFAYHLVLAQYLRDDPEYIAMYRQLRQDHQGCFIIVDNGEAENSRFSFDEVVRYANLIEADEIIMPDKLEDAVRTFEMTTDEAALDIVPANKRFIVPQGFSYLEWCNCLWELENELDGEFVTIGIPKHMHNKEGGRRAILEHLEHENFHERYHIHLLGLAEPLNELAWFVRDFPWIRGIDTAYPIAAAQANCELSNGITQRFSIDWDKPFNKALAEKNIIAVIQACEGYKVCT